MMRPGIILFAAAFALAAAPVLAEVAPGTAVRADPQKVARLYAGKTDLWGGDCGGGIYLSPQMEARAWCAASPEAFAAGRWSVDTQGRLCHTLSWYWPDGGKTGSGEPETSCVEHVEDSRGRIWRRWPGDPKWWPLQRTDRPVSGYKYKRRVAAARAAAGI